MLVSRMRTYKITELKVEQNVHLQKKGEGGGGVAAFNSDSLALTRDRAMIELR